MVSKKEIEQALKKAIHPEINYSLVKLGMIRDIRMKNEDVSITLLLPFLEVPIKEDLINLIKKYIKNLNKNIKIIVKTAEMNKKEKEKFMDLARKGWKF